MGFVANGHPTVTGLLMFGVYPQGFFPGLCITAVSVAGTEIGTVGESGARFIDNKRIEGSIRQMRDEAVAFVMRNMKTCTTIDERTGVPWRRPACSHPSSKAPTECSALRCTTPSQKKKNP